MIRSIFLTIFALIASKLCFADSTSLVSQVKNNLQKMQISTTSKSIQPSLIYGGQDIARPRVASAGDVIYPNHSAVLIG